MLEHIAEIRACRHEHILEGVGERASPLPDAFHQHAQIMFQQHQIGGFPGDIDGAYRPKCRRPRRGGRRIVDPSPR